MSRTSAKARAGNTLKVFLAGYLTGGVTHQHQGQFILADAAAVITDTDTFCAAFFYINPDVGGTALMAFSGSSFMMEPGTPPPPRPLSGWPVAATEYES
ncbi:hypothetical protein AH553_21575 [Salmonella enterica subsp. diarizonae]|nr:hypothetical protein [Salmonella enterica subsp. diarizonae]